MALGRGSAGKGSAEGAPVALVQVVPPELRQTWRGADWSAMGSLEAREKAVCQG